MLFSCSVGYWVTASEPLFGRFLIAGCSEVDPGSFAQSNAALRVVPYLSAGVFLTSIHRCLAEAWVNITAKCCRTSLSTANEHCHRLDRVNLLERLLCVFCPRAPR